MAKRTSYSTFFSTYLAQDIPKDFYGEAKLNCPLESCPNPDSHFYANCEDGTWHCKRCDKSGNARTLITLLHEQYLHTTTKAQYASLSEVRGIGVQILEDAGFAYDYVNDRWLVPYYTYNAETEDWSSFLNNLGYFYPSSRNEKDRYKIKKGACLPLYLYNPGLHQYPPSDTAIICEGEWDTLAYIEAHPDSEAMMLGKPGAGFNASFLKTLVKTNKIELLLDNDDAGRKQTASAVGVIAKSIGDISLLDWALVPDAPGLNGDTTYGNIKDIRDLFIEHGNDTPNIITNAMVAYDSSLPPPVPDIPDTYHTNLEDYPQVESFEQYIDTAKEHLYLPEETTMSMAAVLGITTSIAIEGEPLWAFLIGPPSAGKTQFIDSFGGSNTLFDNLSKISAKSLVSGWKDDTGDEPSYLAKLRDKTLFVKDFTVTLTESADAQREVFGLLTDIFDGRVKIPYGNNQVREFYDIYFNMVAGVTDIVHKHSAASIGERFLRIDYLGRNYDPREFARRAIQNFGKSKNQKDALCKNTLGFVNFIQSLPLIQEIPDEYSEPITDLAEFIAIIRTKVESDKEGIQYRPRAELPARLAFCLCKLFVSVRNVYNLDPNNAESTDIAGIKAFEVVKKVSLDTCYGFPLDIVNTILANPFADRDTIARKSGIHAQKAFRVLANLLTTNVITKCSGHTGSRGGRPAHYFDVNPKLKAVLSYANKDHIQPRGRIQPPSRPRKRRT